MDFPNARAMPDRHQMGTRLVSYDLQALIVGSKVHAQHVQAIDGMHTFLQEHLAQFGDRLERVGHQLTTVANDLLAESIAADAKHTQTTSAANSVQQRKQDDLTSEELALKQSVFEAAEQELAAKHG